MDKSKELAMSELQLVQQVIQQHTELRNRIVAWSVTLNTAVIVALSSQTVHLPKERFLFVALMITLVFFWLDTVHKVTENRAIDRSNAIESCLRGEGSYDGPQIGRSLDKATGQGHETGQSVGAACWLTSCNPGSLFRRIDMLQSNL